MRHTLKRGDRVFSTGCFLVWDGKKMAFGGIEDDTFFDGEPLNWDEGSDGNDMPFIETKEV